MKPRIMFVDDDAQLLERIQCELSDLREEWEMTFLADPEAAWERLAQSSYHALVCDVHMPGLSGLEMLSRVSEAEHTRDMPVMVMTGAEEQTLRQRSIALGALDIINKPFACDELVLRLHNLLRLGTPRDALESHLERIRQFEEDGGDDYNANDLVCDFHRLRERLPEATAYLACLYRVAKEFDNEISDHITRIGWFAQEIAVGLGMDHDFQEMLFWATPLHDIGKVGIPHSILHKPKKLSPGEWAVMQQHCAIGEAILRGETKSGRMAREVVNPDALVGGSGDDSVLSVAATIALTHHEKWNGGGYPLGLKRDQIPLATRITTIADVFDGIVSERPYHPPHPVETAVRWISDLSGQYFDPTVVDAFMQALPRIVEIHQTLRSDAAADSVIAEAQILA